MDTTDAYRAYAARLHDLLRRMLPPWLRPRCDADDLVQEAFICFHARYGGRSPTEAWKLLQVIGKNRLYLAVAFHRARKRSAIRTVEIFDQPQAEVSPLSALIAEEQLAALPADCREVAEARMADETYRSAAKRLGRSQTYVTNRVRRCKEFLNEFTAEGAESAEKTNCISPRSLRPLR